MLLHRLLWPFLMDAAGNDSGGGGGGDTVVGGGNDSAAGGGAGSDTIVGGGNDTLGGGGNLLKNLGAGDDTIKGGGADTISGGGDKQTPEQKTLAAAEKDTRRPKEVPAKYWDPVKGEVNYSAWGKSTTELETRMRTIGLPPKAATEYKFDVPKELKEAGVELDPAMAKAFRGEAHEMGLTQKQYERVMGSYMKHMGGLAEQVSQFSESTARAELLGFYKTEDAMKEHVRGAYKAFMAYADPADQGLIDRIGNIPAVIKILAKVEREMREDPGVGPDAIQSAESIDQLMRGKPGDEDAPYWNPTDARHASVVAKVARHHEAVARARQRQQA